MHGTFYTIKARGGANHTDILIHLTAIFVPKSRAENLLTVAGSRTKFWTHFPIEAMHFGNTRFRHRTARCISGTGTECCVGWTADWTMGWTLDTVESLCIAWHTTVFGDLAAVLIPEPGTHHLVHCAHSSTNHRTHVPI